MGLLSAGTPLDWDETKRNARLVKTRGIHEFLKSYRRFKDERNYPFRWGDEIEFCLVRFDHENKRAQLSLKGEQLLEKLNKNASHPSTTLSELVAQSNVTYHPEYASYMIESTPRDPFDADLNCFKSLEDNMQTRRKFVEQLLEKDEFIFAITNFPRMGCSNFTFPQHLTTPQEGITRSHFFPDPVIFKGHPRFRTLSQNIRKRKNKKVGIYVPIFVDKNTKQPFRDESDFEGNARENHIYLDATGFGMGCCCLQTTFQAESIDEARHLYDQLTPITPILLAITAGSPIWRGYLSAVDCRWNVISGSVDDRTDEELGTRPLEKDRYRIHKSRYDSIDSYLSPKGARYNDIELVLDEGIRDELMANGVDELLARHVAHLFIRDSLVLFKERIEHVEAKSANGLTGHNHNELDDDTDFFENIQSTNWQTMRFKPPPLKNNSERQIGWRVEFRPMELQFTDFENSAFCAFVIMLTQAIRQFNLNFLIPISKVDVNMQRAQQMNACLGEKFFFRKNVEDGENDDCNLVEMTLNEIMNGTSDGEFRGLLAYVEDYMFAIIDTLEPFTSCKLKQYVKLIRLRAQGELMTPAAYIRSFVLKHPAYKHDSVVSDEINYDLLWRIHLISTGQIDSPELLFKFKC